MGNRNNGRSGISIIKVIFFLILIIGAVCLGFYLSYANIISFDKKVEKDEEYLKPKNDDIISTVISEENLEVTNKNVLDLYDMINNAIDYPCGFNKIYGNEKIKRTEIKLDDISRIMLYNLLKENPKSVYSKTEVENAAKKIFGSNLVYQHRSLDTCLKFEYNSDDGTYRIAENTCTNQCKESVNSKIVKATKTTNAINLYIRVLFTKDGSNYYADSAYTNQVEIKNDIINDYNYSKGTLYKLIFTNDNGNYIFSTSEPMLS